MPDSAATVQPNPFLTIWWHPRETMARMAAADSYPHAYGLVAICGLVAGIVEDGSDPSQWIRGAVKGVIFLALLSPLARFIGRKLGGQAEVPAVRAALAWGSVPYLWMLPLSLFGELVPSTLDDAKGFELVLWVLLVLVMLGVHAWCVVTTTRCLAEVQRFSIWRALGNYLLTLLVACLAAFLFLAGLTLISRMVFGH
ncbi:Yip1 domain-containing protein [Dyella sp. OK004]|uniref:YIP1 family protein n=1 Tax=Dyella sp. OK004 TaxID=1855292 RepID=UPI0008DFCDC4|nr:YIP1 family protein [Dyella sp. OK004]SFS08938.1 Yip1 domain-containing protein [Dyella sp. OK004]